MLVLWGDEDPEPLKRAVSRVNRDKSFDWQFLVGLIVVVGIIVFISMVFEKYNC